MRYAGLVVALLIAVPVPLAAQERPAEDVWVGTLSFRDSRGDTLVPVRVTLSRDEDRVTGTFRTRNSSGLIDGTVDAQRRLDLQVSLSGAGEALATGLVVGLEFCQATARLRGQVLDSGVLRLTAGRVRFSTRNRARSLPCEDIRNVTFLLVRPTEDR